MSWARSTRSARRAFARLDLLLTSFAICWLLARFCLFALRRGR